MFPSLRICFNWFTFLTKQLKHHQLPDRELSLPRGPAWNVALDSFSCFLLLLLTTSLPAVILSAFNICQMILSGNLASPVSRILLSNELVLMQHPIPPIAISHICSPPSIEDPSLQTPPRTLAPFYLTGTHNSLIPLYFLLSPLRPHTSFNSEQWPWPVEIITPFHIVSIFLSLHCINP